MNHEEAQELLEDYVDERLDRPVRDQLEKHLSGCPECRSILDGVAPVDLEALGSADVDERTLRRSVRRALWRTVIDAAGLLVLLVFGLWAISNFVVHPLLMNRGGRAAAVARATFDVAGMFNRGAFVDDFTIDPGVFDRTFTARVQMPVGAGRVDLGTVSSRIGLFGSGGGTIWPFADSESRAGAVQDILGRLGGGTVATVSVDFYPAISVDQAQLLAEHPGADVSVVWAGFLLSEAAPEVAASDPLRMLGYSTCVGTDQIPPSVFASYSGNAGGYAFAAHPSSVRNALQEVRRSINHLAEHPNVAAQLFEGANSGQFQRVAAYLADTDPQVEALVVTGPTDEILKFIDQADTKDGRVLAVDFYNWYRPVCGS
ncbi:MAG: zf-HC2 domain-containing protein [Acidimicrobiia bacterium]|nr:zf-HC2 domain-containing protein [Acidimicrobiia bacterium]MDH5615873.1 zf-HC2 domain-containing protein [Acidimicrobiia bacterium]